MRAPCRLCGKALADPPTCQFSESDPAAFPLLPEETAQAPSGPCFQFPEHTGSLTESEVAPPSYHVSTESSDHLFDADTACPPCQFPNPLLEAEDRLRRDAPLGLLCPCEAESEKLPILWPCHRALGLVDLEPELSREKPLHVLPSPAGPPARFSRRCCSRPHSERSGARVAPALGPIRPAADWIAAATAGPPCGVPSSVGPTSPSSITPEFRNPRISFSIRLSLILRATRPISTSWFTRSKNFSRSRSTTQS